MDVGKVPSNSLAARIDRLGFRKWYERELLSGHAHMVLCILSVVALLASMEAFLSASPSARLMNVLFVLLTAAIGLWALRRYLFLMMRAEVVANQANCPDCGEYGRFGVVCDDDAHHETQVCCRKCTRKWVIVIED
jgi:ABC-type nickel/cobalt efflux system permease component RcnA